MPPQNSMPEFEPRETEVCTEVTGQSLLERAFPGTSDDDEALDLEILAAQRRARAGNPRVTSAELYSLEKGIAERHRHE